MTNLAPHWTQDDIEALGGDFDGSLSSLCIMSLSFDFTRSGFAVGGNSNFANQLSGTNTKDNNTNQVTTALQAIQAQAHSHRGHSIGTNSSNNNGNGSDANINANDNSNNNETSTNNHATERDTSSHHAQESMFGPDQVSKQKFQYILAAPISAATKVTDDTMTYLNQGQAYEIKLKNVTDTSEGKKGFMCSIINMGFHERHMQQAENELWQQWSQQHPGERIFSVDMKLSYNVFGVESDGLNKYEFLWDSSKAAGVFIRINSISTEFTLRKHGGEKGIPFKLSIETFSYNSKTHDSYFISAACCQVKVFKPKGAERKIRSDRDKFLKRPSSEQDKYHRSSDHTMFLECPLSSLHPMVDGSLSFYRHSHGHFASKQIEQSTSGTPAAIQSSGHHDHHHENSDDIEHSDTGGSQQNNEESERQQRRRREQQSNGHEDGEQQEQQQVQSSNNSESGSLETQVENSTNQRDDYNSTPVRENGCNLSGAPRTHTDYSTTRLMSAHTSSYGHHSHQQHRTHSMDDEEAQESCTDQQQQQHHANGHNHSSSSEQSAHLGHHSATSTTNEQLFHHHQPANMYHHHHHQSARSVAGLATSASHSQPFNHHMAYYNTHTALPALPSTHHHHHHISSHVAPHSNPLHHLSSSFHPANSVHLRSGNGSVPSSSASYQRQTSSSNNQHGLHLERDSQKAFSFGLSSHPSGTTPFRASNLAISSSSSSHINGNSFHIQPHHQHFGSIQNSPTTEQQQMADDMRADGASQFSQNDATHSHNFTELHSVHNAPAPFHRQRSASTSMTTNLNTSNNVHCSSYIGGRSSESIGGYNTIGDHNLLHQGNNGGNSSSSSNNNSNNNGSNNNSTDNSNNNSGNNNPESYGSGSGGSSSSYTSQNNNQMSTYDGASQRKDSPLSYCSKFRNITTANNQYHSYGHSSSAVAVSNQNNEIFANQTQQHEPAGRFSFCLTQFAITINSSCSDVASWLMANRFGLFLKTFSNFCGSDLLRLSKKEMIEICGLLDGIRLYNNLHNQPVRPKRVLYVCNEGNDIFYPIYLYDVTLRELMRELTSMAITHYNRMSQDVHQQLGHRKKSMIDRSSPPDSRSSVGAMSSAGETSGTEDNSGTFLSISRGNNRGVKRQQTDSDENNDADDQHPHEAHYFATNNHKSQPACGGMNAEQHDNGNALSLTQAVTIFRLLIEGLTSVKVIATDQVVQMLDEGSAWSLKLSIRETGLYEACLTCRTPSSPKRASKC